MNIKPTPAQSILLHAMLSAAVAVIVAAGLSVAQYYFAHGQDLALTATFALGTFSAAFIAIRAAVWHALITNPALPQAEKDTAGQAMQLAQDAHAKIDSLAQSVLPFVHQHPAPQPPQPPTGPASTPASRPMSQPITFPSAHFDTGLTPTVQP